MLYRISVAERGLTGIANIFRSRLSRLDDLLRAGTVPLSINLGKSVKETAKTPRFAFKNERKAPLAFRQLSTHTNKPYIWLYEIKKQNVTSGSAKFKHCRHWNHTYHYISGINCPWLISITTHVVFTLAYLFGPMSNLWPIGFYRCEPENQEAETSLCAVFLVILTDCIVLWLTFASMSIAFFLFKPLSDYLSCMFYSVILFDIM